MSKMKSVRRALIADFRDVMQGRLSDDKIAAAVEALTTWTTSWPCHGEIYGGLLATKVVLHATANTVPIKFDGAAGGVFGVGFDKVGGELYADNILALVFTTKGFEYHAVPGYTGLIFFDHDHKVVGHFQGHAVGPTGGLGGGNGSWGWDE